MRAPSNSIDANGTIRGRILIGGPPPGCRSFPRENGNTAVRKWSSLLPARSAGPARPGKAGKAGKGGNARRVDRLEVDGRRYSDVFGRDVETDLAFLLRLLVTAGLATRAGACLRLTEHGAVWVHRVQCLFSLTWIDAIWKHCQRDAWPSEIVLG
jgi:hypothetical protein